MANVAVSDCYAISRLPERDQAGLLALKLSGGTRDQIEHEGTEETQRHGPNRQVGRVKITMPNNASVVLSGNDLTMSEVVELLAETLKEARKAADQYDVKTFVSMMKDKAKAG